jgi:hypothetical protein
MKRNVLSVRLAMFVGLFAMALAGPCLAQQQSSSGLGSAWSADAHDVSRLPDFHAYAWVRSGVKYIQINNTADGICTNPIECGSHLN